MFLKKSDYYSARLNVPVIEDTWKGMTMVGMAIFIIGMSAMIVSILVNNRIDNLMARERKLLEVIRGIAGLPGVTEATRKAAETYIGDDGE